MRKNVFLFCLLFCLAGNIQAVVKPQQSSTPSYSPMQTAEEKNIACASYESSTSDGTSVIMYSDDEVWQVRFQFSANSLEDNHGTTTPIWWTTNRSFARLVHGISIRILLFPTSNGLSRTAPSMYALRQPPPTDRYGISRTTKDPRNPQETP